ncbi:AHH domain-containing protein [Sorangium sp. So ce394]|uniref:AHH domain-containing protein n=1 Tax=Sorangium sp. So ce394 TaxID=3133310 RepID=UPI003F5B264D
MSQKQHTADIEHKLNHVSVSGATEGGQCLNRHVGRTEVSCSHMWQGFKQAEATSDLYNWPKYKGMKKMSLAVRYGTDGFRWRERRAPRQHEWDVGEPGPRGKSNHKDSANVPYYHEAHHLVPNGVLNGCINDAFGTIDAVLWAVRAGLLDEGYNINHKHNMVLLPLDAAIAKQLELPRHRAFGSYSHRTYSKHVKTKVKKIISANQQNIDNCELTKYSDMKDQLVSLSKTLFERVVKAGKEGVSSLDDMSRQRFK